MVHIFFGDRSLWKIFELNNDIAIANKELIELLDNRDNISSEIDLLRSGKLDSDIISEISQKMVLSSLIKFLLKSQNKIIYN